MSINVVAAIGRVAATQEVANRDPNLKKKKKNSHNPSTLHEDVSQQQDHI